jgi:pyruvate dehydrogenase E1 component beta subunit
MKIHMVAALNQALHEAMKEDPRVMIMGEDVGVDGGVFRVTEGLQAAFGKERVVDTPLAEAGIVGAAIGLSINGMKPVAEIQFDGFTYNAFHQIKQHLAAMRQRSQGEFPCPIVIRFPSGGGVHALELHSENPEAFYAHCQGLKVVIPSGPYDAKGLLLSAIRDPDPVLFFEPKKLYRSIKEDVPEEAYTVPIGKAKVMREGKDITLISWGSMIPLCIQAAEQLAALGTQAEVIDVRSIVPLDTPALVLSAQKTGRVVIVHEAQGMAGMAAEISARIQEKSILNLKAPIIRVTGYDIPVPQYALEDYYLPDLHRIMKAVKQTMEF